MIPFASIYSRCGLHRLGNSPKKKTSLDIFWIKDDSLTDLDNLPDPDILATEIVENIEASLDSFREIVSGLEGE